MQNPCTLTIKPIMNLSHFQFNSRTLFKYDEHIHTDNSFQVFSAESNLAFRYGSCIGIFYVFEGDKKKRGQKQLYT